MTAASLAAAVQAHDCPRAAEAAGALALAGHAPAQVAVTAIRAAAPLCNERYYARLDADARLRRLNTNHGLLALASALALAERLNADEAALALMAGTWQMVVECTPDSITYPEHVAPRDDQRPLAVRLIEGDVQSSLAALDALPPGQPGLAALSEAMLFAGAINLEEAVNRQLRNIGHKAIYAQKASQFAQRVGWQPALPMLRSAVGYIATGPNFFSLYDLICTRLPLEREDGWLDNQRPLAPAEAEAFAEALLHGSPDDVLARVVAALDSGAAALALADETTATAARLVLDCHWDAWLVPVHAFDYCSAVNDWLRWFPGRASQRGVALQALFVNEAARRARLEPRPWRQGPCHNPAEVQQAIDLGDALTAVAMLRGYLDLYGADTPLFHTLALATVRRNHDSHDLKYAQATLDEHERSRTPRRDVLLMALVKYLSDMPDQPECREIYERLRQAG